MKNSKHMITKILAALVLVLGIALFATPSQDAQAAKMTNKKAHTILFKQIKKAVAKYAFVDLDNDKIDELVVLSFNGKFVDGDDLKKTVTVYKADGKKAKSIFSYSEDGDFYHPTLSYKVYRDNKKNSYLKVSFSHEGYSYSTTYLFNGKTFEEIGASKDSIDGGETFFLKGKETSKKTYTKHFSGIFKNEVKLDVKSSTNKLVNKYLKKKFKSEFEYGLNDGGFETEDYSIVYDDLDGDGLTEMIVRLGPETGLVYYVYNYEEEPGYYVGYNRYYIVDGKIEFEVGFDYSEYMDDYT